MGTCKPHVGDNARKTIVFHCSGKAVAEAVAEDWGYLGVSLLPLTPEHGDQMKI